MRHLRVLLLLGLCGTITFTLTACEDTYDLEPGQTENGPVLSISTQSVVAEGHAFGSTGAYQKIEGTIAFKLDPSDPRNAVITDIQNAPRDPNGLVEYSTDFYLLMPSNPAHWNHQLAYGVNNRGNKLLLDALQDASGGNDPTSVEDFGNAFLLKRGYAILWSGWEVDRMPGPNILNIRAPIAHNPDGSTITQRIAVEYSDDLNFAPDGSISCLPLSGSSSFHSYPAVQSQMESAQLWVRDSDSPRPPDVPIPQGTLVPSDQWSFSGPEKLCMNGGFEGGQVYELNYVAKDPLVLGLGYAATRDVISFFRHEQNGQNGTPNPLAVGKGVEYVIGWGASQSGAFLRDYIYRGFNADLQGRRVMDGVDVHIGGALLGQGEMVRFGQLNPWSAQHRGRIYPNVTFPFNYDVRENPLVASGDMDGPSSDGILKRPDTDPLVIQTDSSAEYWWGGASLVDTDGFGHDVALPWNARHYLLAGTQHFVGIDAKPTKGICQQPSNPTRQAPALRALFVALEQWVTEDVEPPPSRRPTVAAGTLVLPDQSAVGFPAIPSVNYNGYYNEIGEKDYGPKVTVNSGVIGNWHPSFLASYKVMVPKVDAIGIDLDGLRVPKVGVPTATLTGWNLRAAPYTKGDLCALTGMYLPLPKTNASPEIVAQGDPRPSLQALYKTHGGYVDAVTMYVQEQAEQRYLLPADAERAIQRAKASDVLVGSESSP